MIVLVDLSPLLMPALEKRPAAALHRLADLVAEVSEGMQEQVGRCMGRCKRPSSFPPVLPRECSEFQRAAQVLQTAWYLAAMLSRRLAAAAVHGPAEAESSSSSPSVHPSSTPGDTPAIAGDLKERLEALREAVGRLECVEVPPSCERYRGQCIDSMQAAALGPQRHAMHA